MADDQLDHNQPTGITEKSSNSSSLKDAILKMASLIVNSQP